MKAALCLFVLGLLALSQAAPVIDNAFVEKVNSHGAFEAKLYERFANMDVKDVKKLLGTKLAVSSSLPVRQAAEGFTAPAQFDARNQWPNCIHPIRNQEQCGSCWAFGATEALSDRFCISKNVDVVLSPEWLVDCDNSDNGCNGGYLQNAWEFMANTGVVSDECAPYESGSGQSNTCPRDCANGAPMKKYHAKNVRSISSDENAIMQEIMEYGPAECAFEVYQDFMSYAGGVYEHREGELLGGHAVKMIGWGEENGKKYWTIANSWGESWGEQGTFRIRRGVDECGIEDQVTAGDAGEIDTTNAPAFDDSEDSMVLDADVIAHINNKKTSWTAEHSPRFAGVSVKEAKKLLGAFTTPAPGSHAPIMLHAEAIPAAFDARTTWPKCIHPIRNQAQCGSCWAFAGSEAFSDRLCIAGGDNVVLSAQDLVSCDANDMGCDGGFLQNAWQYMAKYGLVTDECYPYTSGAGKVADCASPNCPGTGSWSPYFVQSSSIQTFTDEKSMQTAIMTHGPIEASFEVYRDFYSYNGGVYKHETGELMGGHAIKIVGWDETSDGTPYWIVANSWDTTWGLQGFFYILRGSNECAIESNAVAGIPKL